MFAIRKFWSTQICQQYSNPMGLLVMIVSLVFVFHYLKLWVLVLLYLSSSEELAMIAFAIDIAVN